MADSTLHDESRPSAQTFRRSSSQFATLPTRSLSIHERAALDKSDAAAELHFSHPGVRIYQFTPPKESIKSSSAAQIPRDTDYPVDTVETLPWRSRTEKLQAVGPLVVEKVRGSTTFLKCQEVLHAILKNSQCWCVDNVSKFVMRIGPFRYWRIELPFATDEEKAYVEEFKAVLAKVLRYERTPCPFIRAFQVELPDDAITPRRKGPWKRRESLTPATPDSEDAQFRKPKSSRTWSLRGPPPTAFPTRFGQSSPERPRTATEPSATLQSPWRDTRSKSPAEYMSSEDDASSEHQETESDSHEDGPESMQGSEAGYSDAETRGRNGNLSDFQSSNTGRVGGTMPKSNPRQSVGSVVEKFESAELQRKLSLTTAPKVRVPRLQRQKATVDMKPDTENIAIVERPQLLPAEIAESEPKSDNLQGETEPPASPISRLPPADADVAQTGEQLSQPVVNPEETNVSHIEKDSDIKNVTESEISEKSIEVVETEELNGSLTSPTSSLLEPPETSLSEPSLPNVKNNDAIEAQIIAEPAELDKTTTHNVVEALEPSPPLLAANPTEVNRLSEVALEEEIDTGEDVPQDALAPRSSDHGEMLTETEPSTNLSALMNVTETQDQQKENTNDPQSLAQEEALVEEKDFDMNDDSMSTASGDSFHTMNSISKEGDEIVSNSFFHHSIPRPSQHKRELSEITVTAHTADSEEPEQDVFVTDVAITENSQQPEIASNQITTPSVPSSELRQRLKHRRSLSPMPPASTIVRSLSEEQGIEMSTAILQKAATIAVVKPIEMVVMIFHILNRIAHGATVNDLMSGELFRRPGIRRTASGTFDSNISDKAHEGNSEDEDDFGVPLGGRRRSSIMSTTDSSRGRKEKDDDAASFSSID